MLPSFFLGFSMGFGFAAVCCVALCVVGSVRSLGDA